MIRYIFQDLKYIFFKRKTWLFLYIFVMFLFPILFNFDDYNFENMFVVNFGLKLDFSSFINIIMYLLNLSFFIFICFDIFFGNIKIGVDNIFLRITKIKYISIKLLSCIIITIIITFIIFFGISIIYLILNYDLENIISYYFIFIFYRIIIFITILCLISLSIYKINYLFIFIFINTFLLNKNIIFLINPYLFNQKFILLIFDLVMFILSYLIVLKKTIIKIFERSF